MRSRITYVMETKSQLKPSISVESFAHPLDNTEAVGSESKWKCSIGSSHLDLVFIRAVGHHVEVRPNSYRPVMLKITKKTYYRKTGF